MRRADRLFQIINALRRRRTATTATQLAERLGVSERTIYRDIRDLMLAGTPIDGEAGVERVLEILRAELGNALGLCGYSSVADVDASLLRPE